MARDLRPITKLSRREGMPLHRKANKIMVKRTAPPGQHGAGRFKKQSDFGMQLREKQKVKRLYGLLEKQFRRLIKESTNTDGKTGEILLQLLERRMDNVVYRAGFAPSRRAARQLVNHGHFNLNGKRVDIPSIRIKPGDELEVRDKSKKSFYFTNIDDIIGDIDTAVLSWMAADRKKFIIKVTGLPQRQEVEDEINKQLIVEYYSR